MHLCMDESAGSLDVARVFHVRLGGGAEVVELLGDVRPEAGARHGLLAAEGALVVVARVAYSLEGNYVQVT